MMADLVAAVRHHQVTCIVINGANGNHAHIEQPDEHAPPPPPWDAPEQAAADNEELAQLRAQVQQLTAQLATADQALADAVAIAQAPPAPPEAAPPQGDDNPIRAEQGIEMLGLSDPKLERKLIRMGYDTISKLAEVYGQGQDGALWVDGSPKLKKDWLIEIGLKVVAGQGPTRVAAPVAVGGPAGDIAPGVPEGHADRPWPERLAAARGKQATLIATEERVREKQAAIDTLEADDAEVPEELLDELIDAETDVKVTRAQLVATRWCMGLDPDPGITLDAALERANLGPWMENPQPRVLAE
jgi:hypothetical protein